MRCSLQFLLPCVLPSLLCGGVFADTVTPETVTPEPIAANALSFVTALQLAEQQTPSLSAQLAHVSAARASAVPAAALPDPKLIVGVDNVPISGPDRGSLNRDFMTMEKIGVMQDVPNSDKRRARADVANAAVAKAEAEQHIERLHVRQETALAWLNRWYMEKRFTVLTELEHENQLLADTVYAQWRTGKGVAADALMPQQEAAELADRRDELLQGITQAKATLRRWIGDDAYLPLAGDPPQFAFDPTQLHQHLHHHPELAAFGPMTTMAEAEVREAEAEKKSDWGVELNYQRRPQFDDMVSLQFTYDLPLFAESRQTPRIEAKRQALLQLDSERQAMLREHTAELDSDLAQYAMLTQQLTRLHSTRLPLAQQKIDLQMASYRSGRGELSAVLAARREWIEIRLRQIELEGQQAALVATLYLAYGQNAANEENAP